MRAQNMAIMVGTNTVLYDNPSLTNRLWPGNSPLRVTIDRHGRIPSTAHLLDESVPTVVYHDEGLWDEARVEESPCQLCQGVPAPSVGQMHLVDRQRVDGRWISWYEKCHGI